MAHTRGDWDADFKTVEPQPDPGYWVITGDVLPNEFGVVADTFNRHHCISPEEDRANAMILKAAPALLDACNGLLGLLQLIEKRCDAELLEIIRTNHRVVDAKAAIARATS